MIRVVAGSGTRRGFVLAGAAAMAVPRAALAAPHHHKARAPAAAGDGEGAGTASGSSPATTPVGPLDTLARWAIITDVNTGAILLEKAADEQMPPSSLTKLMTAYITFSMLKKGRLQLTQLLPVSEKAWRMQGSKMFVPLGGTIAVADLIRGMIIQSGNDACIVLAEGIAGSEEQFVVQLNAQAASLGMTNTEFRNATGWPDPAHHMSVRDIATLARAIITQFPEYYHFFSETAYKFNNIDQGNRNVLVDRGLADGLKTGHTDAGGFGICASSLRNGHRIIMVLNGMPSSKVRVEESQRLLEWAFSEFELVTLYAAGQAVETAPVWLGAEPGVPLVSSRDIVFTFPHGWRNSARVSVSYDAPIAAPVHKGQALGLLTVSGEGVPHSEIPLVAGADVGRMALPLRSLAVLEHAVTGG